MILGLLGQDVKQVEIMFEEQIESDLKLVHSVCHKFTGEYEDLYQVGCIGLIKAARTFDIDRGYAFSSYAVPIIRNEVLMSLRKKRATAVSFDEPIGEDGNGNTMTLEDTLSDGELIEEKIINLIGEKEKYERLKSLLSPKYAEILSRYLYGKSQVQISSETGYSRQYINKIIVEIRKKGRIIENDYQTGTNTKIKRMGKMSK